MRDSHAGSFGVISIASIIALKVIFLFLVPQSWFLRTLIILPLIGRGTMVYAITLFPYARPFGLGKLFKEKTTRATLAIASLITLLLAGLLLRWAGLLIAAAATGVITGIAFFFRRKFSGLTGDNYGAINEIAEVTVLFMVVLLSNNNWLAL